MRLGLKQLNFCGSKLPLCWGELIRLVSVLKHWTNEFAPTMFPKSCCFKLGGFWALPILVVLITSASSLPLYAEDAADNENEKIEHLSSERLPASSASEIIDNIMQRKELSNEKIVTRWVKKDKEKKKKEDDDDGWDLAGLLEPFTKLFSILFESTLWIAVAIGILLLFITRNSWLHLFKRYKQDNKDYEAPEVMFGMDIRPDSLPNNIPEAARKLWQDNKHRESLSLLYRGALAQLVTIDQLALKSSQTEGDILKLARKKLVTNKHIYLTHLTNQWKQIAYAHHLPEESKVALLFDRWDIDFANKASQPTGKSEPRGEHEE